MNLEVAKKIIKREIDGFGDFQAKCAEGTRYYKSKNDILGAKPRKQETESPLRAADNRIASSYYQLLVNQKAAYAFTAPPLFDVKSDTMNKIVSKTLGDDYAKKAKDLCVNAANAGVAWVYYWNDNNQFKWGVVPSNEIIAKTTNDLDSNLCAVLRIYQIIDENDGELYDVYEYWTDEQCESFRKRTDCTMDGLLPYNQFDEGASNVFVHGFESVPFIQFNNNNIQSRDLDLVKPLIDAYDKTYSGFLNDLEDIQEVIFVLTNYGGENLGEFLKDIKYYKAIQVESAGADDKSGVSTLTIDIPVDAREKMLDITRKAIFDMGQGIDPQQQGLDGTSGEAMKFLYSLLELKVGFMETEFQIGFNNLVRAILDFYNAKTIDTIIQTWTRTSIKNDSELVDMCAKSMGVVSRKTILKHHPFVENVEDEEKELEEEQENQMNDYSDLDDKTSVTNEEEEENDD